MTDIVEKAKTWGPLLNIAPLVNDLITEIERLQAALKPFAKEADRYDPDEGDDDRPAWDTQFTIGVFRRARAALTQSEP